MSYDALIMVFKQPCEPHEMLVASIIADVDDLGYFTGHSALVVQGVGMGELLLDHVSHQYEPILLHKEFIEIHVAAAEDSVFQLGLSVLQCTLPNLKGL